MVATESVATIRVGGGDVSAYAIWQECQFTVSAAATPGTCNISLRDPANVLSFQEGSIIELLIDGQRMWRGYLFDKDQSYVFEDNERFRKWELGGVDLNILLDKFILYNRSDPRKYPDGGGTYKRRKVTYDGKTLGYQVTVPKYTYDGPYIKAMLNDFDLGLVSPTIKTGLIESVGMINPDGAFTPPSSGTTLRNFLIDVSRNVERSMPGSTIWYIDPDGYLIYKAQDTNNAPFWVGDEDPANYIGGVQGENVRGLRIGSSISSIKNDVLTFAGELDPSPGSKQQRLRYSHKINQSSVDTYGRFQYSEVVSQSWLQASVNARARKIINQEGTPGESATFTTFRSGLYPGQILWVSSQAHGVTQNYPIRSISMSWMTPTIVRYDVTCSYDTQDPWGLILALKRPSGRGLKQPDFAVIDLRRNPDQTIPNVDRYTLVKEYPRSIGNRKYQTSYAFIRDSITVYVGKLRQVSMQDPESGTVGFKETAPGQGQFQLADAPTGGKRVYVEYHVADTLE